jgi:hypothetical protein
MELALTEKQMSYLLKHSVNQKLSMYEQDATSDPSAAQPTAGTSSQQSGGQGYPEVGKWESGIERGAGNQIGVTKWADVVGSKLVRGKANPLKEQNDLGFDRRYGTYAAAEKSNRENREMVSSVSKYIYQSDGNFFVDLSKGNISDAISDVRHFFFETYLGMATEIAFVIATDGAGEIGVQGMNVVILLNDIYIFNKNYGTDSSHQRIPDGLSMWEKIEFLYNQNNEFSNILIDTLVVATGGIFSMVKRMSKAAKLARLKAFFSGGKIDALINFFKSIASKLSSFISKLAKPIYEKISQMIPALARFVEYLQGLLAGKGGKIAQKAVQIPLTIGKTYVSLLAIEAGIGTLRLLGRGFGWTANEINLALNGKSTNEMVQKADKFITPADKKQLQSVQGREVKQAYAAVIKGGETVRKTTYQVMSDMKLINCNYNEFSLIPDAKHDFIYVIKNVKYYITDDGTKLIKIK